MRRLPLVSILVPTYNSASTLADCLRSLKAQTYKPTEIIVTDRNSTDGTRAIARQMGARIIHSNASERCGQLNAAARAAKGAYLYRVDSDFLVDRKVVEQAVEACRGNGGAGGRKKGAAKDRENGTGRGPTDGAPPCNAVVVHNSSDARVSFWARVRKFERDMYTDDTLNVAARFFTKKAFQAVGGYDEHLVAGEDYDLHNRLMMAGCRIGHIEAGELHLGEPKTLAEVAAKHYYYGKTLPPFVAQNSVRGIWQLSPIRPAFVRHADRFVRQPVLGAGFVVYQSVKYAASGLGYIHGLFSG